MNFCTFSNKPSPWNVTFSHMNQIGPQRWYDGMNPCYSWVLLSSFNFFVFGFAAAGLSNRWSARADETLADVEDLLCEDFFDLTTTNISTLLKTFHGTWTLYLCQCEPGLTWSNSGWRKLNAVIYVSEVTILANRIWLRAQQLCAHSLQSSGN